MKRILLFAVIGAMLFVGPALAVPVMPSHNYYSSGVQRGAVGWNDSCGCYTPISVDTRGRTIVSPNSYSTEGCDVIMLAAIATTAYAVSSPWTSGLYDQKTLFVTRSNIGGATDSLYVIGSYDATVSGVVEFWPLTTTAIASLAYLLPITTATRGGNMFEIPLPANTYLPYLRVIFRNSQGATDSVTVRICGKSSYGN